jgi:hypothetical protein
MNRVEPDYRRGEQPTRDACAHEYPNNDNSIVTVIDSSSIGRVTVETIPYPLEEESITVTIELSLLGYS